MSALVLAVVIAVVRGAAVGPPFLNCPGVPASGNYGTVSEVINSDPHLGTFASVLGKAGSLTSFLSGHDYGINDTTRYQACYNVLAPSDAAFAALPKPLLDRLLDPANEAELIEVISYHVFAGFYNEWWKCGVSHCTGPTSGSDEPSDCANAMPCNLGRGECDRITMASQPIAFSCDPATKLLHATGAKGTGLVIDTAKRPPIPAANGVVTIVDAVLLPPWLPPVPPVPPVPADRHLYFRGINRGKQRCTLPLHSPRGRCTSHGGQTFFFFFFVTVPHGHHQNSHSRLGLLSAPRHTSTPPLQNRSRCNPIVNPMGRSLTRHVLPLWILFLGGQVDAASSIPPALFEQGG